MLHLYSLTIIMLLSFCKGDTGLPVFLIDHDKVLSHIKTEPNPFSKLNEDFFVDIVEEAIKNSKVVINFVEESFCAEDISAKDNKGSSFRHLRHEMLQDRVRYLPSVKDPYRTLRKMFEFHNLNVYYIFNPHENLKIYEARYGHYYIYFPNRYNETRIQSFRRHDLIIKEVYHSIRKITVGVVLAFYTGKYNPVVVKNLEPLPRKRKLITLDRGVMVESSEALFRFVGVFSSSPYRQDRFSQIPIVAGERLRRRHLTTKVAYTDFEFEFNFSFEKDGWTIDDVTLLEGGEEVGRSSMGVGAPWEYSYVCSEPLVVINMRDGSAVTISHYQIQPFRRIGRTYEEPWALDVMMDEPLDEPLNDTNTSSHSFGASVHCGPYFNSVILGALFVSSICFGILVVAVSAVYNCHSNDRYDDAQGKQLVIATEAGN